MAKLLFEDDNGAQHEINLDTVKSKGITENDVVLAKYEVGDIGREYTELAGQALSRLKAMLENVFPKGVKVAVVAARNGKEDVSIKILKNKVSTFEDKTEVKEEV